MSPVTAKFNPFPGLRPFTQEEDYLFFGREEQTLELLQRLGSNRFVAVVGSSGSGKSSLVRCGLLSELLGGRMLDAGAAWEIAITHPGGNPLALLTDSLLDADLYDREEEHVREKLLATLSRSHFGLVEAVKQANLGEGTNFLLVIDQFEEIFRFHEAGQRQQEVANEFVSLLLEASAQKDVAIYIVLTMRSDFIGECGQFEGLAEMVNRGEFLIPRLNREQFKRVIEGPIKVAGGKIAPRLLQRLLNDLGQQADQLPCLQHALMRTWDVWAAKRDTEALDLDDYQRVGKMSQALSLHADEIYESLTTDRQRELCQGIFQALTVEESNSRGIRRPQRLGRLSQILDVTSEELRPIIDDYRRSGVTFLMPSPEVQLTEQTIIDISHESLMRVWTRLRQWVEEETQAAGIYHRLSESADLHEQNKAGLYRDPELGIALAWREANRPNIAWAERYRPGFETAMRFLETSQQASVAEEQSLEAARQRELQQAQQLSEAQQLRLEQQHRAAGRLRRLIGGLAVVAIIAGLACIFALFANQRANRLANDAQQNEEQAKKNEKRAEESQQETAKVLAVIESQKAAVDESLSKAKAAEEAGRQLLYMTDMRLAPFVWRDDRTSAEQLRVLLAKHVPDNKATEGNVANSDGSKADLRGFEWHYYQHLLNNSSQVFAGHGTPVIDTGFTPTGQLVTVNEDNQIRRWDLGTYAEEISRRPDLPDARFAHPHCLSPDGRLIALIRDNKVGVFNTDTGQELFRVAHSGSHRFHIFSRDQEKLVIVDDKIRWFNTTNGELIASLDQKYDPLYNVALSLDGLTLAAIGNGSTGQMASTFRLDVAARTVVPQAREVSGRGTLSTGAISPDGQMVAVGYLLSCSLSVYDAVTGRIIGQNTSAHASPITSITFSNDGNALVSGDTEGVIKVWGEPRKLATKINAIQTLKGHRGAIKSLHFSTTGKKLASASADQTARVWILGDARASIQQLVGTGVSYGVSISPDGQLMTAATGQTIRLWDAATGQCVRQLSSEAKGQITSVAFSPVDNRLLAVGIGGAHDVSYVALWDIDAGKELARLPGPIGLPGFHHDQWAIAVCTLAFSPDGKTLVAGFGSPIWFMNTGSPFPLKVWDVASRREIRRLNAHQNYCMSVRFSRDGTLMASGSRDGKAIIWSTETWQPKQTLVNPDKHTMKKVGQPGMVECVDFSPDGKILAMGSREGNLHLWDVAKGQLLEILKGHSSDVESVAFTPDGRTLASGSSDQTVRLWNMQTRSELLQLDPGSIDLGRVRSLVFAADGKQLLAGGYGTAAFWSAAPTPWNDVERSTRTLRELLNSNADFPSRIRMFSENLQLHEALEKLNSKDVRVQAALAATQANWYASRQEWPAAVASLDRLRATQQQASDWLRTPGLLRLATALVHQDRPQDAATLLTGGTKRRTQDGLTAIEQAGLGFKYEARDGALRVTELLPEYPGSRGGLLLNDILVKVNDIELTERSIANLLAGEAGTKVRLTVQHASSAELETIELTRSRFVHDAATGESLSALRAIVDERLAQAPNSVGLLNLRAELAGQWSDQTAQVIDLTAAIDVLIEQPQQRAAAELPRLYAARGNAYFALKQWQKAADDYARCVTPETTDDVLLTNQALALAEIMLVDKKWTVLKPTEMKSNLGATLTLQPDDSILASGKNLLGEGYTVVANAAVNRICAIRLEALTHESLPRQGPGRAEQRDIGNSAIVHFDVIAHVPGSPPIPIEMSTAVADHFHKGVTVNSWNLSGGVSKPHTAVYQVKEPLVLENGTRIEFRLQFLADPVWPLQNLGCFRLSVSEDPTAFDQELKRLTALRLTDPWQRLVAAYRIQGNQQAIDELVTRLPRLAGLIGDLFIQGEQTGNEDLQRAVDLYSRGITDETTDFELLAKRARAYGRLHNWTAATADWTRAAMGRPDGPRMLADYARKLTADSQLQLAAEVFESSRRLYEELLKVDSGNNVVAAELAQLLLDHAKSIDTDWVMLKPTGTQTESGIPLQVREDRSIQVQASPSQTPQIVRFQTGTTPIRSVRVETAVQTATSADGNAIFSEYQIVANQWAADQLPTVRGRYVRLDLPGDNSQYPRFPDDKEIKYINLAEVQVFQGDKNIAVRKPASQSSSGGQSRLAPGNAVDGNTVGNDDGNPYAHTNPEANPWWEVDLGSDQAIDRISVWNRSDLHLFVRMNHFRIRVLDGDRRVMFERVIDKAPNPNTEMVLPFIFAETNAGRQAATEPLAIRLPLPARFDLPATYRVSAADTSSARLAEEVSRQAIACEDVTVRLATGYAMRGQADDAQKYFSQALTRATSHDARQTIINLVAHFDPIMTRLARKYPDDQTLQLGLARMLAKRGISNLTNRQPQQAQADLEQSLALLAQIAAKVPQIKWTTLTPQELTSTGGESLIVEDDGSVFVAGPNPVRAVYNLKMPVSLASVTAFRLETIPDSRLPEGGAGRYGNGNYHLAEFIASIESAKSNVSPQLLKFSTALADDPQAGSLMASASIDGDVRTFWDTIIEGKDRPHWAVFVLPTPVKTDGARLNITLDSGISEWNEHGLGHFRLLVTNESNVLQRTQDRTEVKESEMAELKIALATAHTQQGRIDEAVTLLKSMLESSQDQGRFPAIIAAAAADGLLDKLVASAAKSENFHLALIRYYEGASQESLAERTRQQTRTLLEQKLAQQPENAELAGTLANLLLRPFDATQNLMIPTSEREPVQWRHTTTRPADDWSQPQFDDASWFPISGVPGNDWPGHVRHRAEWKTPDIWLRRTFEWQPSTEVVSVIARIVHDDGLEVYINGKQVYQRTDVLRDYKSYLLDASVLELLHPGTNLLAVHCSSHTGPQFIDVGLHGTHYPWLDVAYINGPWGRLAAAYQLLGDQAAVESLVKRHPAAAGGLGDIHRLRLEWEQALVQYDNAITPDTQDARLFAGRAEAHQQLEHLELAIADWTNADRYSADKRTRYADPSYPALEHKALLQGKLKQWEQRIATYTELLRPEWVGENEWMYNGRADSYRNLRQWDKTLADYDRAIKVAPESGRRFFQIQRACQFAEQRKWEQAAEAMRQIAKTSNFDQWEWWQLRDAVEIFAMSGDKENLAKSAADNYRRAAVSSPDDCKWVVLMMLFAPGTITDENRPAVRQLAEKADDWWKPRLLAPIAFMEGDYAKAVELFDSFIPGEYSGFLAAMAYYKAGNTDRAKQLLKERNAWVREREVAETDGGVPRPYGWQDWGIITGWQKQAEDLIVGRVSSEPQRLALLGLTKDAVKAYGKALRDAPDEAARTTILNELAQFDGMLTAVHMASGDWKSAAVNYMKQIESKTDVKSYDWMVGPILWAYSKDAKGQQDLCRKMYERYEKLDVPDDAERTLKVMLLIPETELPSDLVKKFIESFDMAQSGSIIWFTGTRALLEYRRGDYPAAHQWADKTRVLEKEAPNANIKALELSVRALTYAKQKDLAQARTALEQLKEVLTVDHHLKWTPDGTLDGTTILSGTSIRYDAFIPEILRCEAEKLIQSATSPSVP